ncbi:hypothetical protein SBADM41S_02994 [Streptomyces badius]
MALLFSGRSRRASAALAAFAVVTAGVVFFWALRPRPPWFARIVAVTLHSSGQFAVRFVMLLLAGMLGLAHVFGLDTLLGAFAAGMLTRLVLQGSVPERSDAILERVEAMGFGFLVPFFIVTGIDFDLAALLDGGRPLVLLALSRCCSCWCGGFLVYLLAPRDPSGRPSRAALGLSRSPVCRALVVAITAIGLDEKVIGAGQLLLLPVAAAMVSVLVFPLLAFRLLARGGGRERGRGRCGCGGERGGAATGSPASAAVPGPGGRPGPRLFRARAAADVRGCSRTAA